LASEKVVLTDVLKPKFIPVILAVLPQIVPEKVAPCSDVELTLFPFCVKTEKYGVVSNRLPQVLVVLTRVIHHVPVAFSVGAAQAGVSPPPPPLHAINPTATTIQTTAQTMLFLISASSFLKLSSHILLECCRYLPEQRSR
jgi:hypothetical protein